MSLNVLSVDIRKSGYPDQEVIRDIQFTIPAGQLVGLIGPNGAGKSTTIKTIVGLLRPYTGKVSLNTKNGHYTYVPEHPILYEGLTLYEHLELAAASYGMSEEQFRDVSSRLLKKFNLYDVKDKLPTAFSKGMQQKVMLILGFLIESELYIVDEPFIGLDPIAVKELIVMLEEQRSRGAGILMCTHVLDTAEKYCDRFVMLDQGRVIAQGDLQDIRNACGLQGASLFDCFLSMTSS